MLRRCNLKSASLRTIFQSWMPLIFVEGTSDSVTFEILFGKIGYPTERVNYEVKDMGGSSKKNPLTKVYSIVENSLPKHLIILDGDSKGEWKCAEDNVKYLPTSDLEALLLCDLEAVYKGIYGYLMLYNTKAGEYWKKEWSPSKVEDSLNEILSQKQEKPKGKEMMVKLF